MLELMAEAMGRYPLGMGYWLQALIFYPAPSRKSRLSARPLTGNRSWRPFSDTTQQGARQLPPPTSGHSPIPLLGRQDTGWSARAAAYVCRDYRA